MHLETEALSPVMTRVVITVPTAQVNSAFSRAYNQIARSASLPGFRRGRVPRNYLVKRYLQQATEDVTRGLFTEGWKKALDDHDFTPIADPQVDTKEIPKQGKDYHFTMTVEVLPEVNVKPYTDLKLENTQWVASDEIVEHELVHLAERVATWGEITDRDVLETGDLLTFDFKGSIDGELFDGGSAEGIDLELGSGQFIPGFEEQLLGKKVGEDCTVTVTFPEDYNAEVLAGKVAEFACHLTEIKAKVVPEIGPALAEALKEEGGIDAVRTKMREQVVAHHSRETDKAAKEVLKDLLAEQYDFEIPPSLVKASLRDRRNEFVQTMMQEEKVTAEVALEAFNPEEAEKAATVDVRVSLVIDTIAAAEGIDVEAGEVNHFIEDMARSMGQYGHQIRQMYRDSNRRAHLARQMRQDKTLGLLLSKADVTLIEKAVPAHNHDDEPEQAQGDDA